MERSASPRPSQAVAKGVAVVQGDFPLARGVPGGSRPAKVGYRERMGRRTEIELGGSGGTNPRHRTKSPNCHRPGTYTRRSCAERHVFTPGGLLCCPGPSRARGIDWGSEQSAPNTWEKSAEGILGVESLSERVQRELETSRNEMRRPHPAEGPNGATCRMAGVNGHGK